MVKRFALITMFTLVLAAAAMEAGRNDQVRSGLKDLAAKHATLNTLIDAQLAKLS